MIEFHKVLDLQTTCRLPVDYGWTTGELPVSNWWIYWWGELERIPQHSQWPVNYWWTTCELLVNYSGELVVKRMMRQLW